jgi:hypothetical protein
MPGVIPGKGTHNVVFVATEHDSVYAPDADNLASPLWQVSFLDSASGTLYVVAMTMEVSGGASNYAHRLHALDLTTGAERTGSPVLIQASFPGTGEKGATVTFIPRNYKSRPGLLLLNGVVYTSWSSHCDAGTYHGWLMGYDAKALTQVSVYNNTPNGAQGNIYLDAGNGTFDAETGGTDLGESFIKLSTSGGLSMIGYFAPFNQLDLGGQPVQVSFAGLVPRLAGVFQISIQIPNLAPGDYPLIVTIGGVPSNSALVTVSANAPSADIQHRGAGFQPAMPAFLRAFLVPQAFLPVFLSKSEIQ